MDGTQMTQSTASYNTADANDWNSSIESSMAAVHEKFAIARAWKPNSAELTALGDAIADACTALSDLKSAAFARLSPPVSPPPPQSGGQKTVHS